MAMISCPTVRKDVVRQHYDLTTPFYWLLWGRHLHHGLWEGNESSRIAQQRLTEAVAAAAGVTRGERVLDVGCGMGGSSIHLAKSLGCSVVGVTISPLQRWWARWSARWHGVCASTDFRCADAEHVAFDPASFDVVWSIECTEHLFDKPAFFRRAAQWLKPGGRMVICAWLAAEKPTSEQHLRQVHDVCEGFFCPSLGSAADYQQWMQNAGLVVQQVDDWTDRVTRTWEICIARVRRTGMRGLARLIDSNTVMFLDRFDTILEAYQSGAMQYGCFIATKPSGAAEP
jgi:tocopherol O-methyltransferase